MARRQSTRRSRAPQEVFLSHASRNQRFAEKLAETLRRHGVPVWYSATSLVGAQQWHDEIGEAQDRCDWFVVILSPASVKSRWVRHELNYALLQERLDGRIIPILYRECDVRKLSWTLPAIQYVDFTGDFAEGCRDLLRIWGLGFRAEE